MSWAWEARSVHTRALDLRLCLPDASDALEADLRKTVPVPIARGARRGKCRGIDHRPGADVAAAREMLDADTPVGRRLDFMMQEFNREANTLAAKSGDAALTVVALDPKVVIDRMREPVQNVE